MERMKSNTGKTEIQYTLPEIAGKLANGERLNEIERQMAAGVILDCIKQTEARIKGGRIGGSKSKGGGRPVIPDSELTTAQRKRRERYLRTKNRLLFSS